MILNKRETEKAHALYIKKIEIRKNLSADCYVIFKISLHFEYSKIKFQKY